ncbi:MAG: Fis family transcriptional regulator, partial [Alphaproteobacteria bacterium PA3]
GRTAPEDINVRVISASKVALVDLVALGRFSGSLCYRLNGLALRIPPLRERQEDVPLLFGAFLKQACESSGRDVPKISPSVWRRLLGHDWPGNVRELMNFAHQVALGLDTIGSLQGSSGPNLASTMSLKHMVADYEASLIEDALNRSSGSITKTLKLLDLPRKTFYDKVARLGIDLGRFKRR